MGKNYQESKKKEISSMDVCSNIKAFFKTLLLLVILPPMLNYAGLKKEEEYFKKSAVLGDVGFGQNMFMNCSGTGLPTIILDAPTGSTSDVMLDLQRALSTLSTVCVYDRAGMGLSDVAPKLNGSDPGEGPVLRTLGPQSTAVRMAADLHRLVTFAFPQKRPFVLVGSELGGVVARTYAHLHPQDVSGIVLIDPLDESLFDPESNSTPTERQENPWINYWFNHIIGSLRLLQLSAMLGLNRLGLLAGQLTLPITTDDEVVTAKLKHEICDPFHIQASIDEHSLMNESLKQIAEISTKWPLLQNISTTVVSGSYFDPELHPSLNQRWNMAIQSLIQRIPGSKHVLVPEGDRYTIHSRPEEIATIVRKFVKKLSTK